MAATPRGKARKKAPPPVITAADVRRLHGLIDQHLSALDRWDELLIDGVVVAGPAFGEDGALLANGFMLANSLEPVAGRYPSWLNQRALAYLLRTLPGLPTAQHIRHRRRALLSLRDDVRDLLAVLERCSRREKTDLADGPCEPNLLIWKGRPHRLATLQWRILKFAWEHDRATLDKLDWDVWGHEVSQNTRNSAISKLRKKLARIGCPVQISVKAAYLESTRPGSRD